MSKERTSNQRGNKEEVVTRAARICREKLTQIEKMKFVKVDNKLKAMI